MAIGTPTVTTLTERATSVSTHTTTATFTRTSGRFYIIFGGASRTDTTTPANPTITVSSGETVVRTATTNATANGYFAWDTSGATRRACFYGTFIATGSGSGVTVTLTYGATQATSDVVVYEITNVDGTTPIAHTPICE